MALFRRDCYTGACASLASKNADRGRQGLLNREQSHCGGSSGGRNGGDDATQRSTRGDVRAVVRVAAIALVAVTDASVAWSSTGSRSVVSTATGDLLDNVFACKQLSVKVKGADAAVKESVTHLRTSGSAEVMRCRLECSGKMKILLLYRW